MAKSLKDALEQNRRAVAELEHALRDCLATLKDSPEAVAEARFQVIEGGRRQASHGQSGR